MKYTLTTLFAFSMLFFNACEVTNCTAESNKLIDSDWWASGTISSSAYSAYYLDLADDTADSTDSGFGAEYKESCQDFVDVLQDLEESGCSERTDTKALQASIPAYTQSNVDFYQAYCDGYIDNYCDHPSNTSTDCD